MKAYFLHPLSEMKMKYRSDSVWGLICWGIRDLFGKKTLEDFLAEYQNGQAPLQISSTFPFRQLGKKQLFLPVPYCPVFPEPTSKADAISKFRVLQMRKKVKILTYISQREFFRVMVGERDLQRALRTNADRSPSDTTNAPKTLDTTRVHISIDRIKGAVLEQEDSGQLYHDDAYALHSPLKPKQEEPDPMGLYFLADGPWLDKLDAVMRYFSHIGMGGNRSTGKGFFRIESEDFAFPEVTDPNVMVNLSLYHPTAGANHDELDDYVDSDLFTYQLETQKGWVKNSGHSKPPTLMFKEGSVFPFVDRHTHGSLIEVLRYRLSNGKIQPIFRYGLGLMVPMHLKRFPHEVHT